MRNLKFAIVALVIVLAGIGAWFWWKHQTLYPSTDDAYVSSNLVLIAPLVSGRVEDVAVQEHQFVHAGQTLVTIEPSTYRAQRDAAQAQLDIALQNAGAAGANVQAAQAQVAQAQAALTNAQASFDRTAKLFAAGDFAQVVMDQATADREAAVAAYQSANAALEAARSQFGEEGTNNAAVRGASAALQIAEINLQNTVIVAPTSGWVANIALRPGAIMATGQPMFSIVADGQWWIDANFKETDLARIRPGQPASIEIDMYPGVSWTGSVASIGAGAGAVFSLLPPENASGNWVKVTQRFPVRISIDVKTGSNPIQLRVGASASLTVDTTALKP